MKPTRQISPLFWGARAYNGALFWGARAYKGALFWVARAYKWALFRGARAYKGALFWSSINWFYPFKLFYVTMNITVLT